MYELLAKYESLEAKKNFRQRQEQIDSYFADIQAGKSCGSGLASMLGIAPEHLLNALNHLKCDLGSDKSLRKLQGLSKRNLYNILCRAKIEDVLSATGLSVESLQKMLNPRDIVSEPGIPGQYVTTQGISRLIEQYKKEDNPVTEATQPINTVFVETSGALSIASERMDGFEASDEIVEEGELEEIIQTSLTDESDASAHSILTMLSKEASKYPLLTDEQEYALGKRAMTGDRRAIDALVNHNFRFARKICGRYRSKCKSQYDELVMAGYSGLIRAAEKYNPDTGRFTTYAEAWIKREAINFIRETCAIKIPQDAYQFFLKARKLAREMFPNLLKIDQQMLSEIVTNEDQLRQLCEKHNEKAKMKVTVERAREILNGVTHSWGDSMGDKMPGTGIPISETVVTNVGLAEELTTQNELNEILRSKVDTLPPNMVHVLTRRFGLDGQESESLEAIGNRLGVTKERIRQIEEKAIKRLRGSTLARLLGE